MTTEYPKTNVTSRFPTPDGIAYITIVENVPGDIDRIFYHIGKAGSSVRSWAQALADSLVDTIKLHGIDRAIEMLSNVTTGDSRRYEDIVIKSGPQALYLALLDYKRSYTPVVVNDGDWKPSSFANPSWDRNEQY